jgi:hypothetical protein
MKCDNDLCRNYKGDKNEENYNYIHECSTCIDFGINCDYDRAVLCGPENTFWYPKNMPEQKDTFFDFIFRVLAFGFGISAITIIVAFVVVALMLFFSY